MKLSDATKVLDLAEKLARYRADLPIFETAAAWSVHATSETSPANGLGKISTHAVFGSGNSAALDVLRIRSLVLVALKFEIARLETDLTELGVDVKG